MVSRVDAISSSSVISPGLTSYFARISAMKRAPRVGVLVIVEPSSWSGKRGIYRTPGTAEGPESDARMLNVECYGGADLVGAGAGSPRHARAFIVVRRCQLVSRWPRRRVRHLAQL